MVAVGAPLVGQEDYSGSGDFFWWGSLVIRGTVQYHTFALLKSCLLWVFLFYAPEYRYSVCSAPVIYIIQFLFNKSTLLSQVPYYMVTRELSKTTAELEPKVEVSGNRPPGRCDT